MCVLLCTCMSVCLYACMPVLYACMPLCLHSVLRCKSTVSLSVPVPLSVPVSLSLSLSLSLCLCLSLSLCPCPSLAMPTSNLGAQMPQDRYNRSPPVSLLPLCGDPNVPKPQSCILYPMSCGTALLQTLRLIHCYLPICLSAYLPICLCCMAPSQQSLGCDRTTLASDH
jgi:hypothetical protein